MNLQSTLISLLLPISMLVPSPEASARSGTETQLERASSWDLGAVLDPRAAGGEGLPVLAVTPGGAGERIGLRRGDRVLAVNGRPLRGSAPAGDLERAISDSEGKITLSIMREGRELEVSGRLQADLRPQPGSRCGYVTTLGSTPRLSESIFSADITMIDGRSTPLTPVNRHELPTGRHVLIVDERIDTHRFNRSQLVQRSLMRRDLRAAAYKAIVVDIEPDRTYRIGARLLRDRLDNDSIRSNGYWEPVIWSSLETPCR